MPGARVSEVDPVAAWNLLSSHPDAVLIDVRTRAEWSFVGTPDLSPIGKQALLCEWRQYPSMSINQGFVGEVLGQLPATASQLLFICRSGARSLEAAMQTAQRLDELGQPADCINVAEGFEGNLDPEGHRGTTGGWKARGLAWRQS
jgi:rhodanese-related sulfurtransferase